MIRDVPRASGLLLFLAFPALVSSAAEKSHVEFRDQAVAAYQRQDYAAAREALQAALFLRPDSPRYLHNLAAASALLGDEAGALQALNQIADLGVAAAVERDPDLARLQGTPGFLRVLARFAENSQLIGELIPWAELPGRTGLIEGIAYRASTKDLFLGDAHHRCIWRRDPTGRVVPFNATDEAILGVFGLGLDESRQTLWAAIAAVPEMDGYTPDQKGHTGLAEFDLGTGELRRVIPLAGDGRENALGDLIVAPDGSVYATDFKAPIVWRLPPGGEEFEKIADSPLFVSLQGLALQGRTLLLSDHANGLFAIDLATGNLTAIPSPKGSTLIGIDGLIAVPGGFVATQNGVQPERVIHVTLSDNFDAVTQLRILASGQSELTDLSLLTVIDGRPTLVAGSGWSGFSPAQTPHPRPHPVRILQVALP